MEVHMCSYLPGYYIYYETSTEKGSSGAPLIKVAGVNAQPFVVGIHKGTLKAKKHRTANYGVKFETVINHANGIMPKASTCCISTYLHQSVSCIQYTLVHIGTSVYCILLYAACLSDW